MNRRSFLIQGGGLLGLAVPGSFYWNQSSRFSSNPFTLGIASGDPWPDSVVLWTRLAPDPLNGGGMTAESVSVDWTVATDDAMKNVVKRGKAVASPEWGHSVHVEVRGLQPSRWYWYQFQVGSLSSPVGRTRTAPPPRSGVDKLAFAFASCQHYEQGFFTAYEHMAAEELDLVIHLGDYIYEDGGQPGRIRRHSGAEIITVADYRNRYAQYKMDPQLQRAHAAFPWIVTWDDHEVDNNYAGDRSEDSRPRAEFLKRRAAAYQAYFEHMPLRRSALPQGPRMQLYRSLRFGNLAEFFVLDTRQYRTDQPCGDGVKPPCPKIMDPRATLLGADQEPWLFDGLGRSRSRWNVIAQQVMMAKVDRTPGPGESYPMDQWNGYEVARNRMLGFLYQRRPSNPIVITGDIHTNWVADLKMDFRRPESATVGTEFVGTSISSGGDGADTNPNVPAGLAEHPHVKFFNGQRGYVRCTVTPSTWVSDYRIVSYVSRPGSPIQNRASFAVENGRPGAQRAGTP